MDDIVRLVEPAETTDPRAAPVAVHPNVEDYWARVQQLRADLARLRPTG